LHRKLTEAGVHLDSSGGKQVEKLISQREINKKLISLLKNFLVVFKEGQWTFEDIDKSISNLEDSDRRRALSFLNLFKPLFERYENYLQNRGEIDFSDLIRKATEYLESGLAKVFFRRIIVDEYQDISRGRYRLLKNLLKQTEDTRIMCVGDDWQSIYGFTGSDIRMTTSFESLFGFTSRVDLDQTFRFTQPILDSSARFVQTNPIQIKKSIKAREPRLKKSIEIIGYEIDGSIDLKKLFKKIDQDRPKKDCWTVMLLGRYKFNEPNSWKEDAKQFESLKIEFLTIHKSKGLGADVVVVLGLKVGMYGFPGEIPSDPLMNLVLPAEEEFPRAEERRVLYVAMTRAKEKVFLVSDKSNPSEFIDELKDYPEIHISEGQLARNGSYTCEECKCGRLVLAFPNRINGYAWQCSLNPYCPGKSKFCSKCMEAPLSQCMNPDCMVV
jgi:DNA helicase-4